MAGAVVVVGADEDIDSSSDTSSDVGPDDKSDVFSDLGPADESDTESDPGVEDFVERMYLRTERSRYPTCKAGYDCFVGHATTLALSMIREVGDSMELDDEPVMQAAMTLGSAAGDRRLDGKLSDDELAILPIAAVVHAVQSFEEVYNYEISTVAKAILPVLGTPETDNAANEMLSRVAKLVRKLGRALPAVPYWKCPATFICLFLGTDDLTSMYTEAEREAMQARAGGMAREAVLEGALASYTPSEIARAALYRATGVSVRVITEARAGT